MLINKSINIASEKFEFIAINCCIQGCICYKLCFCISQINKENNQTIIITVDKHYFLSSEYI